MQLTKYETGQIFGYIATIFNIILFIPQVRHVYKTQDTYSINKCYLNLEIICGCIRLIYAILILEYPLIISDISVLICVFLIFIQKLKEKPRIKLESNTNIKAV